MLSRRRFLVQSGVCLAGGMVCPATWGQQPRPAISFGFSLYGMRSLTLEAGLEACARIGYDAVELAAMPDWPADPRRLTREQRQRLRQRLRDLNLSLAALMENLPLDGDAQSHASHLERLRAAAELGHDLAPDAPPLVETILGGKPGQWDKLRRQFADRLSAWARLGEKARTVFVVKPHRLQAMSLPEHAVWLMDQLKSPWVKLGYDYSHFQFRQLSLEDTLRTLLPHTRFVHVKDVRLDKERVQFLLPGDGQIDYPALLKGLQAGHYRGCVCVEVSGMLSGQKGYDPLAAARRSYDNLVPAFRKAGLRR